MKPVEIFSIVAVAISLAGQTLGQANEAICSVRFQNVPSHAFGDFFAAMKGKPIVISRIGGLMALTFESTNLTKAQVIEGIEKKLHESGRALINVNDEYFKLVMFDETNKVKVADCPHLLIELRTNSIALNNKTVSLAAFPDEIKKLLTPTTEIWMHDARSYSRGVPLSIWSKYSSDTNADEVDILHALSDARIHREIFEVHFPSK